MLHKHTSGEFNRHLWFHILLCLAPIAGIAAIWLFQIPIGNALLFALLLLCPLSYLFMMRYGVHTHYVRINDKEALNITVQADQLPAQQRGNSNPI